MIENIKQFVNEHQTLIVVIICVLVICFIYWYFCCKEKPLANKVKGGTLSTNFYKKCTVKTASNHTASKVFQCVGININDNLLFTVLNEDGRALIGKFNEEFKKFTIYVNKYLDHTFKKTLDIITVIKSPLKVFVPDINSGSVHADFIEYSKGNTKKSAAIRKGEKIKTMNEVKFGDIKNITANVRENNTKSEKWFINDTNN